MSKIKVLIFVESRYKIDRKRIKASIADVLHEQAVITPIEVSVAIVGDRKMRKLNLQYRNLDKTTNVLSFPLAEGEQTHLPTDITRLGDVVISYPKVVEESAQMNMLVDDRIDELVRHGLLHLLGIHH